MAARPAAPRAGRQQRGRRQAGAGAVALLAALSGAPLPAQGTDQPPAQRDRQVIAHWVPGEWDSLEQACFEGRRQREGGEAVFTTGERPPRTLAIRLRNVAWAYNNAPSGFTRNSLTLYAAALSGGARRELGYGWTEPGATRIGLNLVQLLATCAMVPAESAAPEF